MVGGGGGGVMRESAVLYFFSFFFVGKNTTMYTEGCVVQRGGAIDTEYIFRGRRGKTCENYRYIYANRSAGGVIAAAVVASGAPDGGQAKTQRERQTQVLTQNFLS